MNRISHELNTPLGNSIITANYIRKTNNEILEEFNDGKLSKSHLIEKLSGIDYSTNMLEESLEKANDLMKAFKVFSDHTDHDNENYFDLVYYLKNLIKTYAPLLHNQGHVIKLRADDNIVIYGQTKDYYRIFNHLIRNSIDHGFKDLRNKTITIDISQSDSNLVIKVSDNGIGVNEKALNNIFKPLYKSENSHHGLGLSQVKEIVTALDGEIICQSSPNKSFTTQIKIPITKKKYES
jgi:signal transduction histidine kinase